MQVALHVLNRFNLGIYMNTYIHITMKKDHDLKESKEEYKGEFKGKEGKGEIYIIISKLRKGI